MVVDVSHLTVRYADVEALSDISFSVAPGDYVGVVGPNGSGKTTLVKALLGLVPECSGRVVLFGGKQRPGFGIGYLPQKALYPDSRFPATAREVVASGLMTSRGFPKILTSHDMRRVDQAMEQLEIGALREKMIGRLSGGQQQRVLLARALVSEPRLLVLDEPSSALDPQSREMFYAVVKHLNAAHGTTVLLVSHDIGTVGVYANKLLYLDRKLVFYGSFEEFCRSEVMAGYFGTTTQHVICHRH